jgi:hypothetical protein
MANNITATSAILDHAPSTQCVDEPRKVLEREFNALAKRAMAAVLQLHALHRDADPAFNTVQLCHGAVSIIVSLD